MRRHVIAGSLVLGLVLLLLTPAVAWAPPVLGVEDYQLYHYTAGSVTQWMIDGTVRDYVTSNYTDLRVTMRWLDSSSAQIGQPITFPTDYHVLLAGDTASFTLPVTPPTGWSTVDFTVTGTPTTAGFLVLAAASNAPPYTDADGLRHYPMDVFNDQSFPVTALIAAGSETQGVTEFSASFMDSMADVSKLTVVLASNEGTTVELIGHCLADLNPGTTIWSYRHVEAVPYTPLNVYRFYNLRTGTHFYTADPAERDTVLNTLGSLYASPTRSTRARRPTVSRSTGFTTRRPARTSTPRTQPRRTTSSRPWAPPTTSTGRRTT
jgi:hypothetical protein